jgi:hypothetical protein
MTRAIGISLSSVQRIWRAHQLQPHRLRTFKRSYLAAEDAVRNGWKNAARDPE